MPPKRTPAKRKAEEASATHEPLHQLVATMTNGSMAGHGEGDLLQSNNNMATAANPHVESPSFTGVSPPLARRLRSAKKAKRTRSKSTERTLDLEQPNEKRSKTAGSIVVVDEEEIINHEHEASTAEQEDMEQDDEEEEDTEEEYCEDDDEELQDVEPMEQKSLEQRPALATAETAQNSAYPKEQQPQLMEQRLPIPTNGSTTVNNGKTIPPIADLRMPSQHTPSKQLSEAKTMTTTTTTTTHPLGVTAVPVTQRLNLDHFLGRTSVETTVQQQRQPPRPPPIPPNDADIMMANNESEVRGRFHPISQSLMHLVQVVTTLVTPRTTTAAEVHAAMADSDVVLDDGVEVERTETKTVFKKWMLVCILGLFLEMLLFVSVRMTFPQVVDEIPHSVILNLKRTILGVKPERLPKIVPARKPDTDGPVIQTPPPPKMDPELHNEQLQDVEYMTSRLKMMDAPVADLENLRKDLETQLLEFRPLIREKRASLRKWELSLNQAESQLASMLNHSATNDYAGIQSVAHRARLALGRLEKPIASEVPLITATSVPMWKVKVPPAPCAPVEVAIQETNDALVTHEQVVQKREELYHMARTFVERMRQDDELRTTAKTWMRQEIETISNHHAPLPVAAIAAAVDEHVGNEVTVVKGLSEDDVKNMILDALERDFADTTGVIDYASLYAGAKVIRHGPRATSPSLVETLPLGNKLLARTKLRFYGYGPEAALTPTIPADALGQCWSFSNASKNKRRPWKNAYRVDKTNGKYATLSIELAQPTKIGSVVVEHPPVTGQQRRSALSAFRVFGYTDPKALGRPFLLGEFAYDYNNLKHPMQTFAITAMSDVLMQSVTLAVDSNHGHDYTCLYRFRVQAKQQ